MKPKKQATKKTRKVTEEVKEKSQMKVLESVDLGVLQNLKESKKNKKGEGMEKDFVFGKLKKEWVKIQEVEVPLEYITQPG